MLSITQILGGSSADPPRSAAFVEEPELTRPEKKEAAFRCKEAHFEKQVVTLPVEGGSSAELRSRDLAI